MGLPFTAEQFFRVFVDYNRAFIVAVVALWVASIAIVAHVSGDPSRRSPRLSLFLAVLWLWNAVVYHALFFTRINPAAWLFAGLFLVQAVLFLWAATQRRIEYFTSTGWTRIIGSGLIGYALLYPFLTIALGHRYPATPTFGVPCPTAILTIGAMLTRRGPVPVALAAIPIAWGVIGGSAAVLLAVPTDYVLLGAGVLSRLCSSDNGYIRVSCDHSLPSRGGLHADPSLNEWVDRVGRGGRYSAGDQSPATARRHGPHLCARTTRPL